MTRIFNKDQIKAVTDPKEVIDSIEEGFRLYAEDKVVLAPLSSLEIEDKGIAKIKYGYVKAEDTYVIKIGSFFPGNAQKDKPTIDASMQIYDIDSGSFEALLLDEAFLTNARTAAAGSLMVKYFSPKNITKIGIVGAGVQARSQLEYLKYVTNCKSVMVWGRNLNKAEFYKNDVEKQGFIIEIAESLDSLTFSCNVIITTTSATEPIIFDNQIKQSTLVISIGSDTKNKHELAGKLLHNADLVIADSKEQCRELGNIAYALQQGLISEDKIVGFGDCVKDNIRRTSDEQIIVANLTGVAIQDIQIANLVYKKLMKKGN